MKEVLENIRRIRLEKRFKTKELAEKLGMTPPNYASIEAGRVPLTVERLKEIAIILGVDYNELLNSTTNEQGASNEEIERLKKQIKKLENTVSELKEDKKNLRQLIKNQEYKLNIVTKSTIYNDFSIQEFLDISGVDENTVKEFKAISDTKSFDRLMKIIIDKAKERISDEEYDRLIDLLISEGIISLYMVDYAVDILDFQNNVENTLIKFMQYIENCIIHSDNDTKKINAQTQHKEKDTVKTYGQNSTNQSL